MILFSVASVDDVCVSSPTFSAVSAISAVPSNATPAILRAVASLVAATAVPVAGNAPTSPAVRVISADNALPLTLRVTGTRPLTFVFVANVTFNAANS
ncbi:hypothetical protein EO763_22355 [Pectobacterium odoriferum]|nr:hypothetical protein EO763_22355 [Pectobacterium odoriferum]